MKKRMLLFALVIITITCLTAVTVSAETYSGECGDNLTWKLDRSTGVLEIDGRGAMYYWDLSSSVPWNSYLSIIKTVNIGNNVTSIGNYAFYNCDRLTSMEIGDSVKSIGSYAFSSCDSLTNVVIGSSVTSIGNRAFCDCDSLTSIAVDEANTKYSSDEYGVLFNKDKTTLIQYPIGNTHTSYTIPNSVTSIGECSFEFCKNLTSIVIPDSVKSIGGYAFNDCDSLTIYVYSNSYAETYARGNSKRYALVAGICGDNLDFNFDVNTGTLQITSTGEMYDYTWNSAPWYSYCDNIKSVDIGCGVTSIGNYAFAWCNSLTSIVIPDSVTSIGNNAFASCDSLTNVVIGSSVASIGNYAFWACYSLTSVVIPDSVTNIGDEAFYGCVSLTSVDIGDNVTSIGLYAFEDCDNLTSITVDKANTKYSSDEYGVLFNEDKTTLVRYPIGNTRTSYTIPDSVTSISERAFGDSESLTSVVIPDSVTIISERVFEFCESLTSVVIPDSVTNIGDEAFYGCVSLRIYVYAGSYAETYTKNNGIRYAVLDGDCGDNLKFNFDINTGTLQISGTGNMTNWISYSSVPWYPYHSNIKFVNIGNSVTSIGYEAFYGCDSLTSVDIPDSVTSIGSSAFRSCDSLTSVNIPNSVTSIGEYAFADCDNLTIYGYTGSSADICAKNNNIPFVALDYPVTFLDKYGNELVYKGYNEGETVELPEAPVLEGYTFIGWSNGVNDELITEDFIVTASITLTATYKGNEYVVIFDTNGGSVSQSVKNVTFGSVYGELPVPVREGYEFIGWYTENGKSVTETTIVNTAETHILYAKWTKVYSVKFLNVSGEIIASAEYKTDDKVIFPDVAEITGYTFAGWSYSTTGKIITGNVYVNDNLELYARYNANEYMVVFIANGGSVSTTNKTVTYDSKYGELPVPVLEGYRFAGWYTSATGGEKISENTIVNTTEMQYLYAQWIEGAFLYGDVNADGKVDRKDLTRLAQYFARWDVEIDTDASDANGDGKVDRKDLTRLSQYFARWDVEIGK